MKLLFILLAAIVGNFSEVDVRDLESREKKDGEIVDIHNDPRFQNYVEVTMLAYGYFRIVDEEILFYHIIATPNQGHFAYILESKLMEKPNLIWSPWIGDWQDESYVKTGRNWVGIDDSVLWGGIPVHKSQKSMKVRKWADGKDLMFRILAIDSQEDYIEYVRWARTL